MFLNAPIQRPERSAPWRTAITIARFAFLAAWVIPVLGTARGATGAAGTPPKIPPPSNRVYEAGLGNFSPEDYQRAVAALMADFEKTSGRRLVPGKRDKVGLKVYSNSGPGLATPIPLVKAVIEELKKRGFTDNSIFIVGLTDRGLRDAGFLPPLSVGGNRFDGIPVKALDTGLYYNKKWFYDSPLPSRVDSFLRDEGLSSKIDSLEQAASEDDRKSYLDAPIILDADFWINLPVYSDHPVIGINGALVNATLWNASNTLRFFRSPATGPAAVAEMAAIPEIRLGWMFNLVSLERYQFIGGPIFNSLYTVSEPRLWLSRNAVMLDALMRKRIDAHRKKAGFRPLPDDLRILAYAKELGLGSSNTAKVQWIRDPKVPVKSLPHEDSP